jgi:hypothetical protein
MRQTLVVVVLSAAALFGSAAGADAEVVAAGATVPFESAQAVFPGPGGRALVIVPTMCGSCNEARIAERHRSGRWTLRSITPPGLFPIFGAWAADGAATVLAVGNAATAGADLFTVRRPAGATVFAAAAPVALGGPLYSRWVTVSDARGDIAFLAGVKGPDSVVRTTVVTAAGAGPFGAPQEIAGSTEGATAAVGGGRVVVAYPDGGSVFVRSGTIGGPLGAPELLVRGGGFTGPRVAIDDAGDATVAVDHRGRTHFEHTLLVARARPGAPFGAPITMGRFRTAFGPAAQLRAAGTTTALFWQRPQDARVQIAVANGAGRFAAPLTPLAPTVRAVRVTQPVLAVAPAGDVLLAYAYGFGGAVHATTRRAGSARFGRVHVISKLGEGGWPSVAFLGDGRPLLVYHGRDEALLATTRLTGPAPDLTPPRLRVALSRHARDELRADNAVTVTIRCSQRCLIRTHATLRANGARTIVDGVTRKVLARATTYTERFAFDPERRAGTARGGARVRITVDAQNASGASTERAEQLEL